MKRAQTYEVSTATAQTYKIGYHINDIGSIKNPINCFPVNHDYKGNIFSVFVQEKMCNGRLKNRVE